MEQLDELSLDKILYISGILKIDINGMTFSEIIDTIKDALEDLYMS
ncbi:MAG: hypothetical protein VB106_08085 [Clostridiaceae bacterium]|nr:hypothetical protein [Clostridiaceae bacterium]